MPIDWELANKIPILLWNSPVALPSYEDDQKLENKVYNLDAQME